ncbi:hypothetical protein LLEC1_02195 [Akanthomyces lecanii]|uniref:Zn(2)-C6 fungal-type domain-containing protein n=1 Tax=Cordyceps confragosa TaxID=2714763 RepID=A0A179IIV1_CORDF|nr:hypothetical protein LLEC1_02195 [Akanthomyces lecanii]
MSPPGQFLARKPRRTAHACIPCRQSKIKCSGEEPCANCERRYVKCRFEDCGGDKVTVTQRYLRDLQRQANYARSRGASHDQSGQLDEEAQPHPQYASTPSVSVQDRNSDDTTLRNETAASSSSHKQSTLDPLAPIDTDEAYSIWTSPFQYPTTTLRYKYKNKRNWIWLAPASTWSFTTRLTILLTDKLDLEPPGTPTKHFDEIYPLQWNSLPSNIIPDITGLPSLDHALYLFNTVRFHFGQNYRFFDEKAFVENTREFYASGAAKMASEHRLWFAQFLLVMAFGKGFLSGPQLLDEPPGARYFTRAMSVMPEITCVWKDSLLAIEVMALIGLYLYAIDQRESAHVYVAQAVRIAQMEGLHTQLPEDELGSETVSRCRKLWWMLYIIDRHFSSSLGVPMTTPDSDITTQFDETETNGLVQHASTLRLQVSLSQLLSHIITTIYRSEKTQLGDFLDATRSILSSMVAHAQEIEQIVQSELSSSVQAMSRETRHITLVYHQVCAAPKCVIVATRPVLLSVLKERLEKLNDGKEDWRSFLSLTKPLISTGIKSAVKTVKILSTDDGLLEYFLPFDLEFTYGAAIYLAMANTLFPATEDSTAYSRTAQDILTEMTNKGNKIAAIRKRELDILQGLLAELSTRVENSGLQTLTLASPELAELCPRAQLQTAPPVHFEQDKIGALSTVLHDSNTLLPFFGDMRSPIPLPMEPLNNEFLDNIGISSYEFFNLVEQMGSQDATFTTPF